MGVALWIACGAAAFGLARAVAPGRSGWLAEAIAAAIAALAAGIAATALDFGGWNELDWRAAAFALACSFAAVACVRVVRLATRSVT